jgi:pre-mRNA-processing factor 19
LICSLSSTRKKRKAPANYVSAETLSSFAETSSVPSYHSSKPAGITAVDISADGNLALTGGNDKAVQIYDLSEKKVIATLKGHTKKVTHVAFAEAEGSNAAAISAGADGKLKTWSAKESGKWAVDATIAAHKQDITGLALHPSKSYVATASLDSTWAFHDIEKGTTVQTFEPLSSTEEGSY